MYTLYSVDLNAAGGRLDRAEMWRRVQAHNKPDHFTPFQSDMTISNKKVKAFSRDLST